MPLRLRRGTDTERQLITPLEGELIYVIDTKEIWAGDGFTQGGIKVTGNIPENLSDLNDIDLTVAPQIGQVLKWNGVAFVAADDIDTDTIGGAGDGIVEGSNYQINIVGEDSTILVNTFNNSFQGILFGDVLGDVQGSVLGYDSSIIIDSFRNSFKGNKVEATDVFAFEGLEVGSVNSLIKYNIYTDLNRAYEISDVRMSDTNEGYLRGARVSRGTLDLPTSINGGDIMLTNTVAGYDGSDYTTSSIMSFVVDGAVSTGIVPGRIALITADASGVLNPASGVHITSSQRVGIMTNNPSETLEVNGNSVIKGTLVTEGFVQFGSYTDAEIASITPVNGMVYYNSTSNRFRGYQNSAWINLDDGSAV